jgi:hypothetical protein
MDSLHEDLLRFCTHLGCNSYSICRKERRIVGTEIVEKNETHFMPNILLISHEPWNSWSQVHLMWIWCSQWSVYMSILVPVICRPVGPCTWIWCSQWSAYLPFYLFAGSPRLFYAVYKRTSKVSIHELQIYRQEHRELEFSTQCVRYIVC